MKGVTGRRLIRGGDLRGTWRIKSVQLEGADVTDTPIDFTGGDVNGIEVLLTQQKTDLSGAATNDRGETATDATVIAFADDPEKWGQASRFIESVPLDQNGHFRLQSLPQEGTSSWPSTIWSRAKNATLRCWVNCDRKGRV